MSKEPLREYSYIACIFVFLELRYLCIVYASASNVLTSLDSDRKLELMAMEEQWKL